MRDQDILIKVKEFLGDEKYNFLSEQFEFCDVHFIESDGIDGIYLAREINFEEKSELSETWITLLMRDAMVSFSACLKAVPPPHKGYIYFSETYRFDSNPFLRKIIDSSRRTIRSGVRQAGFIIRRGNVFFTS